MNPDAPKNLRAELETRLTALLLGELSTDDAELLRKLIAHDPELTKLHEQLKLTVDLVRETARGAAEAKAEFTAPLKLSSERREKLLARFKTVQPKEFAQPVKRFSLPRVAVAVAAVLVFASLLSALFLPSLARSKAKASRANFSRNSWTASPALGGGLEERQPRSTAAQTSADQELALRMATAAEHAQMKEQSTTAETLKNASPAAPPVVHSRTTIVLPSDGDAASASTTPSAGRTPGDYAFSTGGTLQLNEAPPPPLATPAIQAPAQRTLEDAGELALGNKLVEFSPAGSLRTGGILSRYSFNDPAGIPDSGNTGENSNRRVSQFADGFAFATAPDTSVPKMGFEDNQGTHVAGIRAGKPVSDRLAASGGQVGRPQGNHNEWPTDRHSGGRYCLSLCIKPRRGRQSRAELSPEHSRRRRPRRTRRFWSKWKRRLRWRWVWWWRDGRWRRGRAGTIPKQRALIGISAIKSWKMEAASLEKSSLPLRLQLPQISEGSMTTMPIPPGGS